MTYRTVFCFLFICLCTVNMAVFSEVQANNGIDVQNIKLKKFSDLLSISEINISVSSAPLYLIGIEKALKALSELIAEQFMQEASELYLSHVKAKLNNLIDEKNGLGVLKDLFANTKRLMDTNHPFRYFSIGKDWREAFAKDLGKLPISLRDHIDKPDKCETDEQKDSWECSIVNDRIFPYLYYSTEILMKLKNNEKIDFTALSKECFGKAGDQYKYNPEVKAEFIILSQLLALLAKTSNSEDITFRKIDATGVDVDIIDDPNLIFAIKQYHLGIQQILNERKARNESRFILDHQTISGLNEQDVLSVMEKIIGFFKEVLNKRPDTEYSPEQKEKLFQVLDDCLDLYQSITKKDYFHVIENISHILKQVAGVKNPKLISLINFFQGFGYFAQNVVNAKNGEEVKAALRQVLLPSLTSLEKRKKNSITISAHPGLIAVWERPLGDASLVPDQNKLKINNVAFTSPVGIEFLLTTSRTEPKACSFGLFFTIIDLGAYVSYRISKSDDEYEGFPGKFKLDQIFSPGVSAHVGLAKSPIVLRFGAQLTPLLRKLSDDTDQVQESSNAKTWRLFLGVSWDIPLLSITPRYRKID